MYSKIRVAILCGGQSGEHEVSLLSAASILKAIDRRLYEPLTVGIDRQGDWYVADQAERMLSEGIGPRTGRLVQPTRETGTGAFVLTPLGLKADVVFPVLHGPKGEDGTLQGMLELMGVPYVGSGVLASAVAMDKAVAKELFAAHGLTVTPYLVFKRRDWQQNPEGLMEEIERVLGYPCFVKPACLGSSLGVSKARNRQELQRAMQEAADLDRKILVEEAVQAREIEVAVLGNDDPLASIPGEIRPGNEFYDYAAKYLDGKSELLVPAPLDDRTTAAVQRDAIRAFLAVGARGMARVDFFLRPDGEILINEINTIPGFTSMSMYPKLCGATGIPYPALITRLIELALERS